MAQAQLPASLDSTVVPPTQDDLLQCTMDEVFGESPVDLTNNNDSAEKVEVDRLLESSGLGGDITDEGTEEPLAKKMVFETNEPSIHGNGNEASEQDEENLWYLDRFGQSTPRIINADGHCALGANG